MGIHDTSSHPLEIHIPYEEESKRLYELVNDEPIWAKRLAEGIVKLHQKGIPYKGECERFYEALIKEPFWAKKLAKGIVKLHQKGVPYKGGCKRFYEELIDKPSSARRLTDEKLEVVEKIVKILSSQLPQIHDESEFTINCFSDFYEVDEYVTDTVVELVQKIPMYMLDETLNASVNGPCFYLLKNNIPYRDESKVLYERLIENRMYAKEIAEGIVSLHQSGIPYSEKNKFFYETLVKNCRYASKFVEGILKLHQYGISYEGEGKTFYDLLVNEPEFAVHIAKGIIKLYELKCFKLFIEDPNFAKQLAEGIIELYLLKYRSYEGASNFDLYLERFIEEVKNLIQRGFSYDGDSKFIFDYLFKKPKFAKELAGGIIKLNQNNFPYNEENKPIYEVLFSEPGFAVQLADGIIKLHQANIPKDFITKDSFIKVFVKGLIELHSKERFFICKSERLQRLIDGIKQLYQYGFSYEGESKKFYDKLIDQPTHATVLAKGIILLDQEGITNEGENKRLYITLMWNYQFAAVLADAIVKLHRVDIPYNSENEKLYKLLFEHPYHGEKVVKGLVELNQQWGYHEEENKVLYEKLFEHYEDTDKLAKGIVKLNKHGLPCEGESKVFHEILFKNAWCAIDLAEGIVKLNEKGFSYKGESKVFYEALEKDVDFRTEFSTVIRLLTPNVQKEFLSLLQTIHSKENHSLEDNASTVVSALFSIIVQHYFIMGKDAGKLFNQALTAGLPGLKRYCSQFILHTYEDNQKLSKLYSSLSSHHTPENTKDNFQTFFLLLSASFFLIRKNQINLPISDDELANLLNECTGSQQNLIERIQILTKVLVEKLFIGKSQTRLSTQLLGKITDKIDYSQLSKLILASNNISSDRYKDVYFNLLNLYLLGDGEEDVKSFLLDTQQADTLGKEIAKHNKTIHNLLRKNGIVNQNKPGLSATEYSEKLLFTLDDGGHILDSSKEKKVREEFLKRISLSEGDQLKTSVDALEKTLPMTEEFRKIKKQLSNTSKELDKLKKSYSEENEREVSKCLERLEKCRKSLFKIDKRSVKNISSDVDGLFNAYHEFLEHFFNLYDEYKVTSQSFSQSSGKKSSKLKSRHFQVEQISKYNIDTLFLGNHVSCCLGVGSSQFSAMVQRILDEAMLFHAVRDLRTNKPVALIWLYFAECDDGKVRLIANFFEINRSYAEEPIYKQGFLQGLLLFTDRFCKDHKIPGFYMKQLTYGSYLNSLDEFPVEELKLSDKLGGAYVPEMDGSQSSSSRRTNHYYYLSSLNSTRFHKFSKESLEKISIKEFIPN